MYLMTPRTNTLGFVAQAPSSPWSVVRTIPSSSIALKPGDLLFWSGTYSSERDPPITHVMIYLGREKKTGARVMVGASDGRTYQSQQRFGVSVFEFKMPQTENSEAYEGRERPRFIGYGHIPRLNE